MDSYDAIIIGSGQGGGPLSTALVAAGKRTAVIERGDVGGTCINTGCTPTKTMVASAATAHDAETAGHYGIVVPKWSTDMAQVRHRKREMVEMFRSGSEAAILGGGVNIIRGTASFTAPNEILVTGPVGEKLLRSPLVVIDTGTRPIIPDIEGIEDVSVLDSTSIMELDRVPNHLVILGGGYIGVEFAQMFRRFGSEVTVIQKAPALLTNEDGDVSDAVCSIFREDGIKVILEAEAVSVTDGRSGNEVTLDIKVGAENRSITGSRLLAAVGRRPNTEDLALVNAGIDVDGRGFVKVDDRLQTTSQGVYAIGDCAGTPPFTHMSYDDFRVLRANLLEDGGRTTRDRLVPYTVFIDPQLGRVGMSEREAEEKGLRFNVARMDMTHVARAVESGTPRGFMKVLVEESSDRVLGCAILGMEGGELMAMVEIAMLGNLPYTTLRDGIFAHPTLAESFNNLFSSL